MRKNTTLFFLCLYHFTGYEMQGAPLCKELRDVSILLSERVCVWSCDIYFMCDCVTLQSLPQRSLKSSFHIFLIVNDLRRHSVLAFLIGIAALNISGWIYFVKSLKRLRSSRLMYKASQRSIIACDIMRVSFLMKL